MSSPHAAAYAAVLVLGLLVGCCAGVPLAIALMTWWRGI